MEIVLTSFLFYLNSANSNRKCWIYNWIGRKRNTLQLSMKFSYNISYNTYSPFFSIQTFFELSEACLLYNIIWYIICIKSLFVNILITKVKWRIIDKITWSKLEQKWKCCLNRFFVLLLSGKKKHFLHKIRSSILEKEEIKKFIYMIYIWFQSNRYFHIKIQRNF